MSPAVLIALSALMLLLPRALLTDRRPKPEVRGVLLALWWLNQFYCSVLHRLKKDGFAPLPGHGPALLVANHTCGIDNLILQAGCRRVLGFLIAREFYDFWPIRPFCRLLKCIPVRRDGHDLAATRAALRALEEGRVVPIFPEGRILPRSGEEIGEGMPGAAFIALHAKVPVVPAYIRGTPPTNKVFRAMVTPSRARFVFGPPIDLAGEFAGRPIDRETLAEATDRLMGAIRALRPRSLALDGRSAEPARAPVG
jgi:1-acyl-sn-glycerol-3-phosphate acyltransferase